MTCLEGRFSLFTDIETLSCPEKILKRMGSIASGMLHDALLGLLSDDKSNLETLHNRDDEIDRQYFLLVRLIRSTIVDKRLASIFNLENIDVLDYRVAANLLETAGDTVVELAKSIINTTLTKNDLKKLYNLAKDIETIHKKSIDAFIANDRLLAIEAIKLHKSYQKRTSEIRSMFEQKKQVPIDFLDLVYMLERVERSLIDIADLIKPIYKNKIL